MLQERLNYLNKQFEKLYPNSKFHITTDDRGRIKNPDVVNDLYYTMHDIIRAEDVINAVVSDQYSQLDIPENRMANFNWFDDDYTDYKIENPEDVYAYHVQDAILRSKQVLSADLAKDSHNFTDKQKGYINGLFAQLKKLTSPITTAIPAPADPFWNNAGVAAPPPKSFYDLIKEEEYGGKVPTTQEFIFKNKEKINKHLSKINDFLKELKYKQRDKFFMAKKADTERINNEKRKVIEKSVEDLLPSYYREMLEKEGIHPMHELDAAQTSPLIFTTESRRKNLRKSQETQIHKIDKEQGKESSRHNLFAHKSYQHYIMAAPHGTKVGNYKGIEYIPQNEKPDKNSNHVGRRDDRASHKIR